MKYAYFLGAMLLTVLAFSCSAPKDLATSSELKEALSNQHFTFNAQQVVPRDYRITQIFPNATNQIFHLDPGYQVKIHPDSLDVYLPFFGRAFQAPVDPAKGGIKFVSSDFDVRTTKGKKGMTEMKILPRDTRDVQQLFLSVSASGYATLSVISTQKESINFYGIVTPK